MAVVGLALFSDHSSPVSSSIRGLFVPLLLSIFPFFPFPFRGEGRVRSAFATREGLLAMSASRTWRSLLGVAGPEGFFGAGGCGASQPCATGAAAGVSGGLLEGVAIWRCKFSDSFGDR